MYQAFDLSGRTALVTGGNGGIGLGMARALLDAGAAVSIWGSNAAKTERAVDELVARCGDARRVHHAQCDVSDEAQVERAFAATVAPLGQHRRLRRHRHYLASAASAYATGEQFLLDGGYTKF